MTIIDARNERKSDRRRGRGPRKREITLNTHTHTHKARGRKERVLTSYTEYVCTTRESQMNRFAGIAIRIIHAFSFVFFSRFCFENEVAKNLIIDIFILDDFAVDHLSVKSCEIFTSIKRQANFSSIFIASVFFFFLRSA